MQKITFKKPTKRLIKKYTDKGYTCVDIHIHTRYSDGLNRIFTILKRCKRKNIGVGITDHNAIEGSLEASKQKDILVIPGVEITSKENVDVLIYFYNSKDLKNFYNKNVKKYIDSTKIFPRLTKPMVEILDDCKKYKCLTVIPHPFGFAYKNISKFIKKKYNRKLINVDAIEVINGEVNRKRNLKAVEWSKLLKKPITAGSDAHINLEVGNVLTCCKADNVKDFLDEIKKGRSIVIGKEVVLTKKVISHMNKIRKKSKRARPVIFERIKEYAPTEN